MWSEKMKQKITAFVIQRDRGCEKAAEALFSKTARYRSQRLAKLIWQTLTAQNISYAMRINEEMNERIS